MKLHEEKIKLSHAGIQQLDEEINEMKKNREKLRVKMAEALGDGLSENFAHESFIEEFHKLNRRINDLVFKKSNVELVADNITVNSFDLSKGLELELTYKDGTSEVLKISISPEYNPDLFADHNNVFHTSLNSPIAKVLLNAVELCQGYVGSYLTDNGEAVQFKVLSFL